MENRIDLYSNGPWADVKIKGSKFHVKQIIGTTDMRAITNLCLNHFMDNGRDMAEMPIVKSIFDMMVVYYCSNIRVKGVNIEKENISLDITSEDVELFENSLALEHIKPYIKNYAECYKLLLKTLEMQNVYESLVGFGAMLPDADKMGETLKASFEALSEAKERDPESFAKIVKEVATKDIREEAKSKKSKSKNK